MATDAIPIEWIEKWRIRTKGSEFPLQQAIDWMISSWRAEQSQFARAEKWAKRFLELRKETSLRNTPLWEGLDVPERDYYLKTMAQLLAELDKEKNG